MAIHSRRRKGHAITAAAAILALAAAGCSSASSSGASSNGTGAATSAGAGGSASAGAAPLGTPNAAKGPALKVGFMTDGQSAAADDISEVPAAQAAVQYVNNYLGGVGKAGYRLSLDICSNNGTPSGATNCGNQFIADKVPIVLWNLSAQGQVLWNILSAAHVPELINGTSDAGPLSGKYSYLVQNQLALGFAGAAAIAGKAKAKHAALFVIDVPAAAGPAKSLMVKLYKAAGVPSGDVVTIPPGTPDMSAQVQAEINKGVDFIYVIGDTTFCTTLLKATTSLSYNGTTTVLANCVAPAGASALPNGYAGIKTVTDTTSSPGNKDVQTYLAAMKKWESGSDPFANGNTAGGFSTIVDFARAMTNVSGTTSADMEAALKSMSPQAMFFGSGLTFQCDGKQVPTAPGICSSGALEETLDKNGQPVGAPTALNTSALLSASS